MVADQVPDIVVGRLPLYLRALINLEAQGQLITSSKELSRILGSSAAQIRKDLSHFGEFGKQGTGYHIKYLTNQLRQILQADEDWNVVLVGAGDLGHALLRNQGIARRGYRIVAAFDISHERIGTRVGNVIIQNSDRLKEEIKQQQIKLAIIAVPTPAAQQVADNLVKAGIKAILNYSPIALRTPGDIRVQNIDPVAQMQHMTYYLLDNKD